MFKRNEPRKFHENVREMIWPSMGWRRFFRYIKYRILRLSDTTHSIAAGLAIGTSLSFTPPGTHFIQGAILAYIFRVNILTALIGTFVGNPWTLPFLWWVSVKFGAMIFHMLGMEEALSIPEHASLSTIFHIATHQPMHIIWPWVVGSYALGVLTWPFSYGLFYILVKGTKKARAQARLDDMHRAIKEMTGQKI